MSRLIVTVFDFDHTLYPQDSILPFLLFAIRRKAAPPMQLVKAAVGWLRQKIAPSQVRRAKEMTLSFLTKLTMAEADALADAFLQEEVLPRIYTDGFSAMMAAAAQGEVLIISASPDVYMKHLTRYFPVHGVIATECEIRDGAYTGRVGANMRGTEKVLALRQYLSGKGLTENDVTLRGYGDSSSDIPLLSLAQSATLVNPKKKTERMLPGAEVVRWENKE